MRIPPLAIAAVETVGDEVHPGSWRDRSIPDRRVTD